MLRRPIPLLAAGAAALACAAPAPASASQSQFTIFEAPREMASGDGALRARTFDEIQVLGVRRMRILLYWNSVVRANNARSKPAALDETNPNSPGYDFSRYDAIMAEAKMRDIEVITTITGPVPRWATGRKSGHLFKPDRNRFERFVEAVGTRYGAQVKTWTIWNEPNQPQFLLPQYVKRKPYSPFLYRALYQAALQGLGATGNGDDAVLAGETSPRGNSKARGNSSFIVPPVTFAKLFFRGKKLKVSGYAHHPYTTKAGPFFKPSSKTDATIGVLSRLTQELDRSSHHRRLGLFLTEFGIQSTPDPFVGVSETQQAEYRSISERIAYDNPRVKAFSQYLMRDDTPRKGPRTDRYSGFESGLRFANGRAKLAYEGFRLPLVADRAGARTVRLWGLVRPATGATDVVVQSRDRAGYTDLATVRTDSRGYWTKRTKYRKGRVYRVKWTTFTGPKTRVYRAP